MPEDRSEYLASGSGEKPHDYERLELIRSLLADESIWSEPPPHVADAILDEIGRDAGPTSPSSEPVRARRPWAAAAALAAALVALVLGISGILTTADGEIVVAIEGTELEADASGEATVRPTGDGWWIRLEVSELGAAPPGAYYEGWVWNEEGHGVSIGTFHLRGEGGSVILWSGVDPADYPAIWVTLEDEDGDPTASERIVMWGRIPEGEEGG